MSNPKFDTVDFVEMWVITAAGESVSVFITGDELAEYDSSDINITANADGVLTIEIDTLTEEET